MPGALHAALTVLEKWGTMSFEDVAAPAIDYAENGFPMRQSTAQAIRSQLKFFETLAGQPEVLAEARRLARTSPAKRSSCRRWRARCKRMVEAERAAKSKGRAAGHRRRARSFLQRRHRARDGGVPAEARRAVRRRDFAEFFARIEEPAKTTYRGYTVYKHGFGSQGPVLLQTLNILENFDLQAMGYASADYLHTVIEAMKLAYADRDTYYADPAFVTVPAEGLLSKAYAKERAALIDPKTRVDDRSSPAIR